MSGLKSKKVFPVTIHKSKGVVPRASIFYRGKCVVLDAIHGEIVLFSSSDMCIEAASDMLTPAGFHIDMARSQNVSICSSECVISVDELEDQHFDKLTAENKRLKEALVCIKNAKDTYDDTGFEEVLDEIDSAIEAVLQKGEL